MSNHKGLPHKPTEDPVPDTIIYLHNKKCPIQQVTGNLCRWPWNQSLTDPFGLDGTR